MLRDGERRTLGAMSEVFYAALRNYAEAYWAPDMLSLILQATVDQYECDQLFHYDLLTGAMRRVRGSRPASCGDRWPCWPG